MKRGILALVVITAIGGGLYYYSREDGAQANAPGAGQGGVAAEAEASAAGAASADSVVASAAVVVPGSR